MALHLKAESHTRITCSVSSVVLGTKSPDESKMKKKKGFLHTASPLHCADECLYELYANPSKSETTSSLTLSS